MRRYLIIPSAIIMQLCLGATYSWSVYVQPLKALTGINQGPIQLPFSVFYFVFPATMLLAGGLLTNRGPRFCAVAGGFLFGGGWILASLGAKHFAFTIIGIGILGGLGAGMAYIVPIATCIRWFPKHKGLVTGVAVAGFGGGAALVSQFAGLLMNARHWSPFATFGILGLIFMAGIVSAGLNMQNPPHSQPDRHTAQPAAGVVSGPTFWILYLAMFTGLTAGFAVNANLKELYPGQNVQIGIAAVSLFALANALGRVSWGLLFDRMRSASAIQANLACQALALFASPWILRSETGLLALAAVFGFNYGGVLVVYASSTARCWGSERMGQIYGWLFSANIPAALAPLLAGIIYDLKGSFTPALLGIGVLLSLALLLVRKKAVLLNAGDTARHED